MSTQAFPKSIAPICGTQGAPGTAAVVIPKNDPLHISSLFVILFVSTSAAVFPIIATRYPRLHIPSKLLFILKHFGTGVLVATAFCHLLPTAFISLLDPCLQTYNPITGQPDGKGVLGLGGSYPALSGAIAMAGVFLVATVEMVFAEVVGGKQRHHHHRSDLADGVRRSSTFGTERSPGPVTTSIAMATPTDMVGGVEGTYVSQIMSATEMDNQASRAQTIVEKDGYADDPEQGNDSIAEEKHREQSKKAVLQCLLLEMGILFHSIFIGLALSVSSGKDFAVLFIAIIFHQTFEGMSLGTRIALLEFPPNKPKTVPANQKLDLPVTQSTPYDNHPPTFFTVSKLKFWRYITIPNTVKPYLMAFTYGCTTPLGQAIGLALLFSPASNYDPSGKTELLLVGSANAISSGLLLWAGLVELLSADFFGEERGVGIMSEKRWRWAAWFAVFCGAASMATVGAWA